MGLQYHIDSPAHLELPSQYLRMRGWAFVPDARLQGVRLFNGKYALNGAYGLARPDVAAARRDAPGIDTGFELAGRMPAGSLTTRLEFRDDTGRWHCSPDLQIKAPRWVWPRWIHGGNSSELLAFQMAAHATHPPHPITPEKFSISVDKTSLPRLSIVTPSFQQRDFLNETILSVLTQPGVSLDYSIQDGGSSDGSAELIQSYSSRLTAWLSKPDGGQADAIARGFENLPAEENGIMAWINSDDFYLPGALSHVATFFARNPTVDVIYGHRLLVDENSQEIGRWFLPPHDGQVLRLYDFVPQETLFWRRRIWNKVQGLDRSLRFAMDWDLLLRFQSAGAKIVRLPRFLAAFRVHPAQKTSAQMHTVGQEEIDRLRRRSFGRDLSSKEIEYDPRLKAYLRKSALLEFANKFGFRGSPG
jgi:glycosyltransferase involved in cell wall biosynthesis